MLQDFRDLATIATFFLALGMLIFHAGQAVGKWNARRNGNGNGKPVEVPRPSDQHELVSRMECERIHRELNDAQRFEDQELDALKRRIRALE